ISGLLTGAGSVAGDNPEVVDWLASVAQERGDFAEARRLYSHLVDLSFAPDAGPYAVKAHIGLSASAVKLLDFDTAEKEAFAAIDADPTYAESYRNLFVAQYRKARTVAKAEEN